MKEICLIWRHQVKTFSFFLSFVLIATTVRSYAYITVVCCHVFFSFLFSYKYILYKYK